MRAPRIFTKQTLQENTQVELEEAPSHHLLKVLRLKAGAELIVFNGKGGCYHALITHTNKKQATIEINLHETDNKQSPLHTHLIIGLSRGERFEFALQKACELGANEITPIFSERTEVKIPKERVQKKHQSWQQILTSSCEQNQRNIPPVLNPVTHIESAIQEQLANQARNGLHLALHHRTDKALHQFEKPDSVNLLVGPEGGLSSNEIKFATQHGFNSIALGPRVLRTETAPIVALSCCQMLWGDI